MAINLNIVSKFDDKGIKQINGQLDGVGKTLGKVGGVLAAAFSVKAIADFTKEAVLAAEGVATANARIDNIAKSMGIFGDEADAVTNRLIEYAESNELLFATDAEVIKSTQAKLLTFKELANTADETGGSFDRATQAAIDLAAAGFGAAETNAIQLGKALNDPIKGISALTRSGVTFTESEKELIRTLVESGDTLAAQDMILKAIETQVGGTAAATADASDKMALAFDNVKETVGLALLPAFEGVTEALLPLIEYLMPILEDFMLNRISPALESAAGAFGGFVQAIIDGNLIQKFIDIRTSITQSFIELIPKMVDAVMKFLPAVIQTLLGMIPKLIETSIKTFMALVDALVVVLPLLLQGLLAMLPRIIETIVSLLPGIIKSAITLFTGLIEALVKVIPLLIKAFYAEAPKIMSAIVEQLPAIIEAAFSLFSGIIEGLIDAIPDIIDAVVDLIPVIVKALMDNLPKIIQAGVEIVKGLAKGIIDNAPRLLGQAVASLGNTITSGFKSLLGIRSPSKVFEGFGENIVEGLINGIDSMKDGVALTAQELADLAQMPMDKAIESLKGKSVEFMQNGARVFAQFNAQGQLQNSFTDAGPTPVTSVTGEVLDVNAINQIFNSEYASALEDLTGGTQQVLDSVFNQVSLFNPKTGMSQTIGANSPEALASAIERSMAEGFTPNVPFGGSSSDLIDTLKAIGDRLGVDVALASGGVVTGPMRALIGEAGPEAVIPLDRLSDFGGSTYNITVNAGIGTDPVSLGREVVNAIKRYESVSGKVFATA